MFDDPASVASTAFAFRIGERLVLSAVVVLVAFVVTLGFWRTVQKVDFSLAKAGAGGTVVLTTPVLALFALIGFAWVSFSHPISVTIPTAPPAQTGTVLAPEIGDSVAATGSVSMVGAMTSRIDHERQAVTQVILGLNCVASQVDRVLSQRDSDALTDARFRLMETVWSEDWGEPQVFIDWAMGFSDAMPPADAVRVFEGVHPLC